LQSNLHDVEAAHLESEKSGKDAKRHAKSLEAERTRLTEELNRARSDLERRSRHENGSLRQQVVSFIVIALK